MHGKEGFFGKTKSGKWSWEANLEEKNRKKSERWEVFEEGYMGKRRGPFSRWDGGGFQEKI